MLLIVLLILSILAAFFRLLNSYGFYHGELYKLYP
jgi:hypothetical protein